MTEYGVTSTGFRRKTADEIRQSFEAFERSRISENLDVSELSEIGNINYIVSDQMGLLWEALEAVYFAQDPDAAEFDALTGIGAITGVTPRGPQKGSVVATITVENGFSAIAGELVAHVIYDEENRWVNRDATGVLTSGSHDIVFESEGTGSDYVAAAGTLIVKATGVTGWLTVTNAEDATPGTDAETSEEFRIRRDASLEIQGSGTLGGIVADVGEVDGIISVDGEENRELFTSGGLPAKTFRIVVWDGSTPAADDEEIARAIYNSRGAGVLSYGGTTVSFENDDGDTVQEKFDRATHKDVYIDLTVDVLPGTSTDDIKAALIASQGEVMGKEVVAGRLQSAVFGVSGVDDVTFFTLGYSASPSGTVNLPVAFDEIALLDTSRIDVSVNVI